MEELLRELIEFMRGASPELWRIAMKQVMVYNVTNMLTATIVLIFFFVAFKAHRLILKKMNDDEWDFGGPLAMLILGALQILSIIVFFAMLESIITGFVNPEWAAIHNLMNLLPK